MPETRRLLSADGAARHSGSIAAWRRAAAVLAVLCGACSMPSMATQAAAAPATAATVASQPAAAPPSEAAGTMRRFWLNTTDPAAVCNDGTSAAYYFRPGSGDGADRWIIRFQGGAWCIDADTCQNRMSASPWLMSSDSYPATTSVNVSVPVVPDVVAQPLGIHSPDAKRNYAFHNWNHAYVWYCTSDSFLGDTPGGLTAGTQPWSFRGRRVAAALADQLLARQGLGNATDVLVAGDSAGGVAALNNADFLLQRVKASLPSLRRWKTYADAGWFLDIPSFADATMLPMRAIASALQLAQNATFDATCTSQLVPGQEYACFFGQYWWNRFPLPTFISEYLYDSANLGFDFAASPADDETFRQAMTASLAGPINATGQAANGSSGGSNGSSGSGNGAAAALQSHRAPAARRLQEAAATAAASQSVQLNAGATGRPPSVFSQACKLHEVIDGDTFFAAAVNGTLLYDAVVDWFFNGTRYEELDTFASERTTGQCTALPAAISPAANQPQPAAEPQLAPVPSPAGSPAAALAPAAAGPPVAAPGAGPVAAPGPAAAAASPNDAAGGPSGTAAAPAPAPQSTPPVAAVGWLLCCGLAAAIAGCLAVL